MLELLRFLVQIEIWVYIISGVAALVILRQLILAWRDWRSSLFGLERETAQRRFTGSLTFLILLVLFSLAEFFYVSFIAPAVVNLNQPAVATPADPAQVTPQAAALPTKSSLAENNPIEAANPQNDNGCVAGQIDWTFPAAGERISGTVELRGTVNVTNLGFYKFEYSQPGTEIWTTIAAGNGIRVDEPLGGLWNTGLLTPGDYFLRLVVADNANNIFPACVISIQIVAPSD